MVSQEGKPSDDGEVRKRRGVTDHHHTAYGGGLVVMPDAAEAKLRRWVRSQVKLGNEHLTLRWTPFFGQKPVKLSYGGGALAGG